MSSNSLAFAHSGGSSPRRYRPVSNGTPTSLAADAAIRQMVDRRRSLHGGQPEPSQSPIGRAIDGVTDAVGGSIRQLGLPQWMFRVVFVGLVAAALGSAVFLRGATKLHSVDGVLLADGRPVPRATVTFLLPGQQVGEGRTFETDQAGGFRTEVDASLRQGLYTVVVQPSNRPQAGSAKKGVIPVIYTDPATSPLRVVVSEDLTGLKLLVRRR